MMRRVLNCSIALIALAVAGAATAQTAPVAAPAAMAAPKVGTIVKSSDGRTLGRVDRVNAKDGAPVSVNVIVDGRLAHIPMATLSGSDGALVTSLTKAEASKLN
jgi:hypothetical protein